MSDKIISTLFTGCGGVDLGAKWAGLKHGFGIEFDNKIAQVAIDNGFDTMVADVRDVDYASLQAPYWLHMSPVCKSFSKAKVKGVEQQLDIECAKACVRAIKALNPPYVSVENVSDYEKSKSFNLIVRCLMDEGYNLAWWILNSADYGVPQTRKRLILVASRIKRVIRPNATHQERLPHEAQLTMFDEALPKWVSWYEATKGVIPTLKEVKQAKWTFGKLPSPLPPNTLFTNSLFDNDIVYHSLKDTPCNTVVADSSSMGAWKLWDGDKFLGLSPRFVATLQSFPISYTIPELRSLGFTVMGNAVPPLLIQRVIEAQGIHETNK